MSLDHCLHLRLCQVKVDVDVNIDANANVLCEQGLSSNWGQRLLLRSDSRNSVHHVWQAHSQIWHFSGKLQETIHHQHGKMFGRESFTWWLVGAGGRESNVSASPLPPSAKCSNKFDYSSHSLGIPTVYQCTRTAFTDKQQECIPVGCVPSAAVPISLAMHAPCHTHRPAMHAPLPHMPPATHAPCHVCPPCHASPLTCMSPTHAPYHACPPPPGQNSWHTLVKTLPLRNNCCGW